LPALPVRTGLRPAPGAARRGARFEECKEVLVDTERSQAARIRGYDPCLFRQSRQSRLLRGPGSAPGLPGLPTSPFESTRCPASVAHSRTRPLRHPWPQRARWNPGGRSTPAIAEFRPQRPCDKTCRAQPQKNRARLSCSLCRLSGPRIGDAHWSRLPRRDQPRLPFFVLRLPSYLRRSGVGFISLAHCYNITALVGSAGFFFYRAILTLDGREPRDRIE
jgi:hypothetical protein